MSASGGVLTLNITSVGSTGALNWNGTVNGNWNVSADQNFFNTNTNQQDGFFQGDSVTLGDATGVITAINKVGLLQPSAFSVTSSTNNYTIAGTGSISGVALSKLSGTSALTLSTGNDLTGAHNRRRHCHPQRQ